MSSVLRELMPLAGVVLGVLANDAWHWWKRRKRRRMERDQGSPGPLAAGPGSRVD